MQTMVSNSFCFGLYAQAPPNSSVSTPEKPNQIGFARLITDYVTSAYLTDVYVLEEERGKGLGVWLISCVGEVLKAMLELRRATLIITAEKREAFYGKYLGSQQMDPEKGVTLHILGPRAIEYKNTKDH